VMVAMGGLLLDTRDLYSSLELEGHHTNIEFLQHKAKHQKTVTRLSLQQKVHYAVHYMR